ncbi:MAG: DUF1592 domain-containing protein [Planctomycetota bacterium]
MPNFFRTCLVVIALSLGSFTWAEDAVTQFRPSNVNQFLQNYCIDCHEGDDGEGGFDLLKLTDELADARTMDRWVRILDRVHDGEMPPPEDFDVDKEEAAAFVGSTNTWLVEAQQQLHAKRGRVQSRRLTNEQLERTLHDLLAIDLPLASLMPEEQRTDAFANIADAQSMSHFHLETHLTVVDAALDAAFDRADQGSETWQRKYTARDLARRNPRQRCRDPEMLDGKAVVWNGGVIYYGRITSTTMRESGWYRVTFDASSLKPPDGRGVWCSVRSGRCTSGAPLLTWIGSFEAGTEATQHTFEAWIPAGHMLEIRPADATLKKARFRGGQVGAGEGGPQNVPGLALHSMSIERIHPGGNVELVRQHLFGDLEQKRSKHGTLSVARNQPRDAFVDQVRTFASRAFRRPVSDEILAPYLELVQQSLEQGAEPADALRRSYRAILCSPRFLYLVEPRSDSTPRWAADRENWSLDDFAIASRLSYLLWGSMPDDELFRLAGEGALQNPSVLAAQVERMLGADRGKRFLKDFSAQWLDLVDIDFTEPDRRLHNNFDVVVQNSMLNETHQFLASLLDENANIRTLVDADYTFLNSRLAKYYGIDGVDGDALQRVSLPVDSNRGGLLAQGAILKVTANGTNTSPVLRGIWVSERILGVPIPPPPESVPAVEPDIRGAKTIRDQLQKHLADSSCAVCHRKIDPPGFALENFDAAGRWREKYPGFRSKKDKTVGTIDPSYTMADGRPFGNFAEFRSLVAEDPRPIAKNFVEKLMVFGTGAPVDIADREVIDAIVEQAADDDYGMRSLLHAVVTSPTFLSK